MCPRCRDECPRSHLVKPKVAIWSCIEQCCSWFIYRCPQVTACMAMQAVNYLQVLLEESRWFIVVFAVKFKSQNARADSSHIFSFENDTVHVMVIAKQGMESPEQQKLLQMVELFLKSRTKHCKAHDCVAGKEGKYLGLSLQACYFGLDCMLAQSSP